MKKSTLPLLGITLAGVLALLVASASAQVNYQFVTVGNPGNANDTTGYGGVSYTYDIGTYDVTLIHRKVCCWMACQGGKSCGNIRHGQPDRTI